MSARYAEWHPGRVVARSLGFGAGFGALIGFLVVLALVVIGSARSGNAQILGGLAFVGTYALVIGAVFGTCCGFIAGFPLLLAGLNQRTMGVSPAGRRVLRVRAVWASLAAGGGAALLPAMLAVFAAGGPGDWAIAWEFLAALTLPIGFALGPHVLYGRPAGPGQRPARIKHADLDSGR
jgi:hypothetical protein